MLDDDATVAGIKESFARRTATVKASPELVGLVRKRFTRRRRSRNALASAGLVGALAWATIAISTSQQSAHPGTTMKAVHLSGYTFKVRSDTTTSTTCLTSPNEWVSSASVPSATVTVAGFLRLNLPDGSPRVDANGQICMGAVLTYTTHVPTAIGTVQSSGEPTVYLAEPTTDARIAYIALDTAGSVVASQVTGGPAGVTYYIIGEIPSDNDQAVLVAILQQGNMADLLSIHNQD